MILALSLKHFLQSMRSYLRMRPIWQVHCLHSLLSFPYFLGWVLQSKFGICGYLLKYLYLINIIFILYRYTLTLSLLIQCSYCRSTSQPLLTIRKSSFYTSGLFSGRPVLSRTRIVIAAPALLYFCFHTAWTAIQFHPPTFYVLHSFDLHLNSSYSIFFHLKKLKSSAPFNFLPLKLLLLFYFS